MGRNDGLKNLGLLNVEMPDLGELVGENRDKPIVYCSSFRCNGNRVTRYGRAVSVGEYGVRRCPYCGNEDHLFHDSVSIANVPRIIQEIKEWSKINH